MKIFKAEADAGLSELIKSNASIAYDISVNPFIPNTNELDKIKAFYTEGGERDKDLYYVKSILVTSCWNKNDDVFSSESIWSARNTPAHKPTNIEHDEEQVVGHITGNWAIDVDGKIIPDDTVVDELPDLYHILTSSVIYTNWTKDYLVNRTEDLIANIESGDMFVSMECLFAGFDYAVVSPQGEHKVIARNEETAFLSKHLRSYGGTGEYEGYKVGRLLRNITFCGKGFVKKPANPDSIIFNSENIAQFHSSAKINTFKNDSGVLISCNVNENSREQNNMADQELLKAKEDKIAELEAKLESVRDEATKAAIEKSKAEVEKANKELEDTKAELEEANKKLDESKAEVKTANDKVEELTKSNEELNKQLETVKAEEVKTNRVSALVDKGVDKEEAESIVAKFAGLDDDLFAEIVETHAKLVEAKFMKEDDKKKKKEDKEKNKAGENDSDEEAAEASENDLDDAEEEEELDLTASESEEDDTAADREKLVAYVAERTGKKTSKGE